MSDSKFNEQKNKAVEIQSELDESEKIKKIVKMEEFFVSAKVNCAIHDSSGIYWAIDPNNAFDCASSTGKVNLGMISHLIDKCKDIPNFIGNVYENGIIITDKYSLPLKGRNTNKIDYYFTLYFDNTTDPLYPFMICELDDIFFCAIYKGGLIAFINRRDMSFDLISIGIL